MFGIWILTGIILSASIAAAFAGFRSRGWRQRKLFSVSIWLSVLVLVILLFATIYSKAAYEVPAKTEAETEPGFEGIRIEEPLEIIELSASIPPEAFEEENDSSEWISFTATAYCGCEKCCGRWAKNREPGPICGAAGTPLIANTSVAIDNTLFKFGTTFVDEAGHTYIAADTGSGVTGYHIDIYMEDHNEALQFGRQTILLKVEG